MTDENSRALSREKAKLLRAGSDHYTAFVGPPKQYDFMGATQFRLLTALGLREHHKVLDFGCGSLRAGRLLIAYLLADNYFGIDPNRWLIDDGIEHEIGSDLIRIKRPKFDYNHAFSVDVFGEQFDFIVAQSIFSHAGRDVIIQTLRNFKECLRMNGLIVCTFIHEDKSNLLEFKGSGWVYPECVAFRIETLLTTFRDVNLQGVALPWFHPRQTWYALAHDAKYLPPLKQFVHLSGAVLRDAELASGC